MQIDISDAAAEVTKSLGIEVIKGCLYSLETSAVNVVGTLCHFTISKRYTCSVFICRMHINMAQSDVA